MGTQNRIAKFGAGGTADTDSLMYDNGSNVGLNTTNPSALGGSVMTLDIRSGTSGDTSGGGIKMGDSSAGKANVYSYGSKLYLETVSGDIAIMPTNGNVGIGTASPGAKLDINGQVRIQGGSPASGKFLKCDDANGTASWVEPGGASGIGDGHSLDAADGSPTDVVYVDNQGLVGIGITNPNSQLHIKDSSSSLSVDLQSAEGRTSEIVMYETNYDTVFHIQWDPTVGTYGQGKIFPVGGAYGAGIYLNADDGNVGIGTTSPSSKLDVNGDVEIGSSNVIYIGDPTTSGTWRVRDDSGTLKFDKYNGTSWDNKGSFGP